MFYTESYTLAKVLCLSVQEVREAITNGIHAVIERAEQADASVLVTFCLPFQSGLERAHWDIRTLRKTAKGAIKDGEVAFSSGDAMPRAVPCTRSLEHWTDPVVAEISKKLGSEATAVCLDALDESDTKKMDPSAMENMIEMLKADRRKIIETNKAEVAALHEKHKDEMEKMLARVQDAEQEATTRIGKVAQASKTAEDVLKKKETELNAHNITLREQVLALEKSKEKLTRDFNAANLRNDEEAKKAEVRQRTLEAQVASLKSNIAKTTAEWAKQKKDIKEDEKSRKRYESKITELSNTIKARDAANKAVEASAREARELLAKTQYGLLQRDSEVSKLNNIMKGYKVVLKLAAVRLDAAVEKNASDSIFHDRELELERQACARAKEQIQATVDEMKETIANHESLVAELQSTIEAAEQAAKKHASEKNVDVKAEELADLQKRLKESEQEVGRKQHLLSETDKRVKYLERTLKESDEEVRSLKTAMNSGPISPHNEERKNDKKADKKPKKSTENEVSVNVNQNTAVYMQPPPHPHHQQAFPQAHYNMDPNLENTISTLHAALNTITAMARSSSTNGKNAEIAQAKLDALGSFGMFPPQQQQVYYEGPPPQHFVRYAPH